MNADDLNFAYKVRHALNEHLDHLPPSTTDAPVQLAQRQLAGNIGALFSLSLFGRMSVIVPLLALVAGLAGIYQYEEQQRIAEMAELDAAVLSDELPLTAYLDDGFNAYLEQRAQ
jgi:hypothetical protein